MRSAPRASERASVYIALLFLLLTLSALGLAFAHREAMAGASQRQAANYAQAGYLASAAANHALWRLTQDCSFPSGPMNAYAMRDMDGGRYGYKVARRADGTLVQVAAIGQYQGAMAQQSYVVRLTKAFTPSIFMFFSNGVNQPYGVVNACTDWSDPAATFDSGNAAQPYIEVAASPTRREIVLATLDGADDVNASVWNGTSWGNKIQPSTTAKRALKTVGVAYESLSGKALVVARSGPKTMAYNSWNGLLWSNLLNLPGFTESGISEIGNIELRSDPSSNEILIAFSHDKLFLYRWSGSSFARINGAGGNWLEDKPAGTNQCFDIAYEQSSGDALIVWGRDKSNSAKYAVWNGTTLGAVGSLPDIGKDSRLLRLAPQPGSDRILAAAVADNGEMWIASWNGSAWTDSRELPKSEYTDSLSFDIGWESTGGEALVAYGPKDGDKMRLATFRWSPASGPLAMGTLLPGPNLADNPRQVRALADPLSDRIYFAVGLNNKHMQAVEWNGAAFRLPGNELTANLSDNKSMPFDIVFQGNH